MIEELFRCPKQCENSENSVRELDFHHVFLCLFIKVNYYFTVFTDLFRNVDKRERILFSLHVPFSRMCVFCVHS